MRPATDERHSACFNNQTYIGQKVPSLYTAATVGDDNTDTAVYGSVNPFILTDGAIVEVIVNNLDAAIHPFHMHGHQFQVLSRPESNAGSWSGSDDSSQYPSTPTRRDTVAVNGNSHVVLRIKADNPGVFLFHCHIEWHVEMGLTATFIEAPDKLQGLTIPADHLAACRALGTPTSGNAAGNSNPTDTSGFITVPPSTYTG